MLSMFTFNRKQGTIDKYVFHSGFEMPGASHPSSASRLPRWDLAPTSRHARLSAQRDAVGEDARTAIPPETTLDGLIGMLAT